MPRQYANPIGIQQGIRSRSSVTDDFANPRNLSQQGRGRPPVNNDGGAILGAQVNPNLVGPWPMMVGPIQGLPTGKHTMMRVNQGVVARGGPYRIKGSRGYAFPGGVQAGADVSEALGYFNYQRPVNVGGTQGVNVISPLFGRPGYTYVLAQPKQRIGPVPKLAPGTGRTGIPADRSRGFVPAGFASSQLMNIGPMYDYGPNTDSTRDLGPVVETYETLPRSIGVGIDGIQLVGTYRAHDFTPADRFFKQGRSSANWQQQSFGPNYRWLTQWQQAIKYNLRSGVVPSRPISPSAYFLGYQMYPGVQAQVGGGGGMSIPLGYGAS